ncbi:MAG: hypothetical protein LBS72_02055 [Oscillospiraceae bacterium]|nr:hypothetical protein [Oscillospiraceae bacterium]
MPCKSFAKDPTAAVTAQRRNAAGKCTVENTTAERRASAIGDNSKTNYNKNIKIIPQKNTYKR